MNVAEENKTEEVNEELSVKIDYKMVTFTLAGKDYGIDIMKVAEISKAGKFTYVPNSAPFVKGVYNLRGDIISVIDLRLFFSLPTDKKESGELENMVILRLEDHVLGVIVDRIDRVVGISRSHIQPPHPLFGDINIEYISGVVENSDKLYIILDVEKIFSMDAQTDQVDFSEPHAAVPSLKEEGIPATEEEVNVSFFKDTLKTFKKFYTTPVNEEWVKERTRSWKKYRDAEGKEFQLSNEGESSEFLMPFYSAHNGAFWSQDLLDAVGKALLPSDSGLYQVWNPGCGKGYETYSIACLLRSKYPDKQVRIHAGDSDLLAISAAPALNINRQDIPESCHKYITESVNGYQFNTEIKNLIRFEYHDVNNPDHFSGYHLICARDIISFLSEEEQGRFITSLGKKIKPGGVLLLGDHEVLPSSDEWDVSESGNIKIYIKK